MHTLLWVLQALTALLFAASGYMKVFMFDKVSVDVASFGALPREVWKALGVLELVCVVLLIVPSAMRWRPSLTVLAAAVLALEAIVFVGVHIKYREVVPIIFSLLLGLTMAFIAYGRHVLRPIVAVAFLMLLPLGAAEAQGTNPNPVPRDPSQWRQHSMERPKPPVEVAPAQRLPVAPPPGALVLFDGKHLDWWEKGNGQPAAWKLVDGAMEVVPGSGGIRTKVSFGDIRLHIEWASPNPPVGTGQDRGNSGVFLMSTYEVQVLDSYRSDTYADGQAGAIYGQFPPRVNVTRPPGEWNSYDIEFRRPRFDSTGAVVSKARLTVRHNGVLIHDDVELLGPTSNARRAPYEAHPDALPIALQDHDHLVRFRNIWVQPLAP